MATYASSSLYPVGGMAFYENISSAFSHQGVTWSPAAIVTTTTSAYDAHSNNNASSGLSPEEEMYYNMSYRFKLIMSQPHQILALVLGFIAITSNILSILALRHCNWSMGCYFKLLMSLSISDVLIGTCLVLHKLSKVVNPAYRVGLGPPAARLRFRCIFMVIKALNNTALNSTLLNLMAMALDHYIAIIKPLHYHSFMSDRRRHMLISLLWLLAALMGFSDFFSGLSSGVGGRVAGGLELNYCEVIWVSPYQEEFMTFGLAAICLSVMSYIYIRIYLVVRRQQRRDQLQQTNDLRKNKKALYTTLLVLGSFVLCWLPNCLFQIAMVIQVRVNPDRLHQMSNLLYHADQYLTILLYLNAICDPIIYVSRLREIRHGYACIFYRCCCYGRCYNKYPVNGGWRGGRRRQSESITLDYSLSSHHRKSSAAMSNNGGGGGSSMPEKSKTEKSNSTQSNHSFQTTLPPVIENSNGKEELNPKKKTVPPPPHGLLSGSDTNINTDTNGLLNGSSTTNDNNIQLQNGLHEMPLLKSSAEDDDPDCEQETTCTNGGIIQNNGTAQPIKEQAVHHLLLSKEELGQNGKTTSSAGGNQSNNISSSGRDVECSRTKALKGECHSERECLLLDQQSRDSREGLSTQGHDAACNGSVMSV